jgi:hypothetical protein
LRDRSISAVPECVEVFRGVAGGGVEVPVGVGIPVRGVPRGTDGRTAEFGTERLLFCPREVLEQATQRQRGRANSGLQPGRVKVVGLPAEGRAQAVERADEMLGLSAG